MNINTILTVILILLANIIFSCGGQEKEDAADFFLKANVSLTQNNYAEALRLYDEAIAKNADFSDAYLNKGITLLKMNRAEEAYEILTEAITIDPTLVQANLVRAEAGLNIGKINESLEDLAQIEKEYKDSSRFYLIKGDLLSTRGTDQLAIAEYDKAISLDKSNVEAYVNRGALYYRMKSYPAAKSDFEKALALDSSHPQALNNLGLILSKEKDWQRALACFDKVLSTQPDDAYSLNNKGYVLLMTGAMEEGKRLVERALDKQPRNGYAWRNLGIYYTQKKMPAEALKNYLKAIDKAEPVDQLYGLTGQAYLDNKQIDEACKIWNQGVILKDSLAIDLVAKHCR
ncbi:Lipopolysaccharide assembly protein B [Dyadobacter sp. CECT 9623]|uniref:Lipopolysaccharide assembly protein B n=1 Tax=Dyadobacter linearis TaxID=2823330 RepID=A0ABM8UNS3_9BACT|nr:tetratricopeptide repeat protein [Dyadobacter sp. CECT 9623]CAG5069125.1 Lipopolysaccharide assembly protein B [Dyadobacter sp. CECT 9623]